MPAWPLLLAVLTAQQPADPAYAPPDTTLPIPMYTTLPEDGGVFVRVVADGRVAVGWKFTDGSDVEAGWQWGGWPRLAYRTPVWETEDLRVGLVVGSEGVRLLWEKYLGNAVAAVFEGGKGAGLMWYPWEGIQIGLDLLRGLSLTVNF
jgi:hypothetical protein